MMRRPARLHRGAAVAPQRHVWSIDKMGAHVLERLFGERPARSAVNDYMFPPSRPLIEYGTGRIVRPAAAASVAMPLVKPVAGHKFFGDAIGECGRFGVGSGRRDPAAVSGVQADLPVRFHGQVAGAAAAACPDLRDRHRLLPADLFCWRRYRQPVDHGRGARPRDRDDTGAVPAGGRRTFIWVPGDAVGLVTLSFRPEDGGLGAAPADRRDHHSLGGGMALL